MLLALVLLFFIGPIAEIYVLLKAGGSFGVLPVIAACVATALAGGVLLRLQGLAAINKAQRTVRDGGVPVEAVVDGVFLAMAAPLLMTPGFITDLIGFLFLTPPFRHWAARRALAAIRSRIARGDVVVIRRGDH